MNALMALDHMHANDVVHRDLHTGNLLIDNSRDGEKRLLVGDFGESVDFSKEEQALLALGEGCALSKVSSLGRYGRDSWSKPLGAGTQTVLVPTSMHRIC